MSSNPVVPAAAPEGRWWPAILGLLVLMGGLFFFRLGDDMALQSHEALLAETSRNMYIDRPAVVDDGSRPSPWLVPNFGDSPRLRKTPLPYWTVACLAHLTGGVDEWTARFPSAVAALGTVLLILLLVRRWTDRPTALLAGLALATSVGFAMIARQALSDMPMTFYSTAALAALWVAVETRGPRRFVWLVVSGAIGGLAMLAKGPAPLLVFWGPSLAAIFLMIAPLVKPRRPGEGGRKEWFWCLAGIVAACVVALAIMLPWPIYVLLQVSEAIEIWRMESVGRSLGEYGHTKGESVFFYLTRLPVLLAPWIIFFVYGVALGVKRLRQVATDRPWLIFLASWLVPTLVSFSLAAGKQDHYILPFLPAAAVLTGMAMRRMLPGDAPAEPQRDRWLLPLHAILSIVMGAGAVIVYAVWRVRPSAFEGIKAVAPFATPEILGPVLVVGLVGIVAGLAAWVLARRRPGLGLARGSRCTRRSSCSPRP